MSSHASHAKHQSLISGENCAGSLHGLSRLAQTEFAFQHNLRRSHQQTIYITTKAS